MCNSKHDSENFMVGVMLGAVVGGVLGILFAPQEGKKTREKLRTTLIEDKEKAAELAEQISGRLAEAKEKAQPFIDEIKEKIDPVMEKVGEVSAPVRKEVANYIDTIRGEITDSEEAALDKIKKKFFRGVKKS